MVRALMAERRPLMFWAMCGRTLSAHFDENALSRKGEGAISAALSVERLEVSSSPGC
jgi:hypothetical protein